MTTATLLLRAWDFDPSVIAGCVLLIALYFWRTKPSRLQAASFLCGIAVLFLALESPIDTLGDTYLFSAHMLQHLLLILIVPPLLLWGVTGRDAERLLRIPIANRIERALGKPFVAWLTGILVMVVWHWPVLYNFALAHEAAHIFQHLTFLISGTIFWWPVLSPVSQKRMAVMPAIFYLFAAAAANTILGIIITFMPIGYYPAYVHPADEIGALSLVRNTWGVSAQIDQRLGGLLMWVPGCSVYFIGILLELAQWYSATDQAEAEGKGELETGAILLPQKGTQ
ncbi:MAG: cytochrome c oxidase assembly protein [Acidobacteriaceae bacterium]